jgi:hypothetical protein
MFLWSAVTHYQGALKLLLQTVGKVDMNGRCKGSAKYAMELAEIEQK